MSDLEAKEVFSVTDWIKAFEGCNLWIDGIIQPKMKVNDIVQFFSAIESKGDIPPITAEQNKNSVLSNF